MRKIKSKIAAAALIVILLTLFTYSTIAYFSTAGVATNVVTSGSISFRVHETTHNNDPFPEEGLVILPGDVVKKEVRVENVCDHPFYLRIKLDYSVNDTQLTAADCFALDINTNDWEYYDGWYYYKAVVKPDKTTPELFSHVEIVGSKVDNSYIGKKLTLSVVAQAVQSENNPLTGSHTYTALGWPAE